MPEVIPQTLPPEVMKLAEEFDAARKAGKRVSLMVDRMNYSQSCVAELTDETAGSSESITLSDRPT